MPADAETGLTTGELDGKPLSGVNIFAPDQLAKSGLSLDPPEDEDEDEEILDLEDDEDVETEEENAESDTNQEDADIDDGEKKLLEKYKSPAALAKALRHAQKKLSEQGNELGQYRGREGALLDLVKRAGVSNDAPDEPEDDGVPRDEYGIPKPADGYWRETYLPQLKNYFTEQFIKEGYEESEAKMLAAAEAAEKMIEERLKWRESYEAKRSEAIQQKQVAEEEEVRKNSSEQEAAITTEQTKIADLCAKMGVDPEQGIKQVMEVAGEMVTRALKTGQLTRVQASRPETAQQAIWGAWAYIQSQGLLPDVGSKPQTAHAPTQTGKAPAGSPPKPRIAEAASKPAGNYSSAHKEFAKGLGITPEELEKKYGRL